MGAKLASATVLISVLGACETHDIGQPCPQLLRGQDAASSTGNRAETQEVVEQNVAFPCEELICVATAGRPGYCSRKCREDAGCPDGFGCRVVQPVGPFAGQRFCAWKRCDSTKVCGNLKDFCCSPVPNSAPEEDIKYCNFKSDGSCT